MPTRRPPDLESRAGERELIDDPRLDAAESARALRELSFINSALGGHSTTLEALGRLLPPGRRRFDVLDVGCGGGDTARRIVEWARRRGMEARVHGIDVSPEAVAFARREARGVPGVDFAVQDLFALPLDRAYDIVHAALLLHHLDDEAAVRALRTMYGLSRLGLAVNDLHRHRLAYYSIRWLTALLSGSRLVRHDAPLSVLRAFRRPELEGLCRRASLPEPDIAWRWAFRWRLVVVKR